MKIWKLAADINKYAYFSSEPRMSVKEFQSITGQLIGEKWRKLSLIRIDDGRVPLGDAVGFDYGFLVSQRAREVLEDCCGDTIEFLPADYNGHPYYLLNVLRSLNCLDKEKSEVIFSRTNTERIIAINRYSFISKTLSAEKIFRLESNPLEGPFINEEVVEAIRKARLTGMCFDLIWDSDWTEIPKVSFGGVIHRDYASQ